MVWRNRHLLQQLQKPIYVNERLTETDRKVMQHARSNCHLFTQSNGGQIFVKKEMEASKWTAVNTIKDVENFMSQKSIPKHQTNRSSGKLLDVNNFDPTISSTKPFKTPKRGREQAFSPEGTKAVKDQKIDKLCNLVEVFIGKISQNSLNSQTHTFNNSQCADESSGVLQLDASSE